MRAQPPVVGRVGPADGLVVETHPEPEAAVCDGPRALRTSEFAAYAARVEQAALLAGRRPLRDRAAG